MTEYAFPSPQFPDLPTIRIQADEEWEPVEVPGTFLAVQRPTTNATFRANITALLTRHSRELELDQLIDQIEAESTTLTDAKVEPPFSTEVAGRQFVGRILVFRDAVAGTLAQLHLLTRVDQGTTTDVVHLVGTCAGDQVADDLPALQRIMTTAQVQERA